MPASVMEQIRLLDADVTVDLRWNGERLTITIGEYVWAITVKALSARRGPASEARLLYEEDPASLARRQEAVARKRERREPRVRGDAVDRAKLRALKRGG